jgi:ankyrin repeat protein
MIMLQTLFCLLLGAPLLYAEDIQSKLLRAAEIGDVTLLKEIIAEGTADLEMKWKTEIPLHIAAANGKAPFVRMLIEAGVAPDIKDFYGFRAITMAVSAGETGTVEELIKAGADLFAEDEIDELKYYLLETAAQNGHVEMVHLLLAHGMNINYLSEELNTPLIMAALHGHDSVVGYLISAGADVKIKNMQGNTALLAAAYKGHAKVVRLLVDAGLDPNDPNADGTFAIVLATRGDYTKVVRELIRGGANVNVVDSNGNTPLSVAAKSSHLEMVNILLATRPDLETTDSTHHTALHHTYINNHREASRILALAGASHGPLEGQHDGLEAPQIPKVPVCYWFRGLLKRFKLSQKQTRGKAIGRKACEYLAEVHGFQGSIVKLLDKISFYGYRTTVDNLGFETFVPLEGEGWEEALENLKRAARGDLKSMHTKDYKEHFRQTDEDELEKNLPSILRKFGADIPKEKGEDELSLADIANERVSRKEFHRAPKEQRPDHFKQAETVPGAAAATSQGEVGEERRGGAKIQVEGHSSEEVQSSHTDHRDEL